MPCFILWGFAILFRLLCPVDTYGKVVCLRLDFVGWSVSFGLICFALPDLLFLDWLCFAWFTLPCLDWRYGKVHCSPSFVAFLAMLSFALPWMIDTGKSFYCSVSFVASIQSLHIYAFFRCFVPFYAKRYLEKLGNSPCIICIKSHMTYEYMNIYSYVSRRNLKMIFNFKLFHFHFKTFHIISLHFKSHPIKVTCILIY